MVVKTPNKRFLGNNVAHQKTEPIISSLIFEYKCPLKCLQVTLRACAFVRWNLDPFARLGECLPLFQGRNSRSA